MRAFLILLVFIAAFLMCHVTYNDDSERLIITGECSDPKPQPDCPCKTTCDVGLGCPCPVSTFIISGASVETLESSEPPR